MAILNMMKVRVSGTAVVKITKEVLLPQDQARALQSNDEAMKKLLETDNSQYEVHEWDIVFGERLPKVTENG